MMEDDFEEDGLTGDQWISATDLMGGAVIIFILLLVQFILSGTEESEKFQAKVTSLEHQLETVKVDSDAIAQLKRELEGAKITADNVKDVAVVYDQKRQDLYRRLLSEFSGDLPKWNAEIFEDLTIRFNEPETLFDVGSANLKEQYRKILDEFFPRYLRTIQQDDFRRDIAEIRIEGHTSSFWKAARSKQEAYLRNMDLSHERTRSVLHYVMGLPEILKYRSWLRQHLTANGLSSAKLIYNDDGVEDSDRSQRVEFKIRTDAESRIAKILQLSN